MAMVPASSEVEVFRLWACIFNIRLVDFFISGGRDYETLWAGSDTSVCPKSGC